MKVCASIAEPTVEGCLQALAPFGFAEVRLDGMHLDPAEAMRIFSRPKTLIATHRPDDRSMSEREALMVAALEAGACFIDVEVDAPRGYRHRLLDLAHHLERRVIVSSHRETDTPGRAWLQDEIRRCRDAGADLVKIACMVRTPRDNARLLGLLDDHDSLLVIGMGPLGRPTRLAAPLVGSPFTYASAGPGLETAAGQLDVSTLARLLRELGLG